MNTETENEVEERKSFIPTSRPDDHTVNCHDIGEIPRDEDSTFQLDTSVENPPVIEEELETLDHNARRASFMTSSQRTLASIKPEDEVCGWGPLKPGLCQRFRNPKWVLVCLCMAGVCQGMIVNGFVFNSISSIERRFDLKSSETGLIASGYDFASLVCLIPVSYFGGVGRKPYWLGTGVLILGIGSMIFMLPHFTTGVYMPSSNSTVDTCQLDGPSSSNSCETSLLNNYKYMFLIGQLLHGVGATPLFTLGVSYLDDNLLPSMTSLYVGIFYSLSILGPAVGFLLGGVFLNIYTDSASIDPADLQLTTSSPKWVGSWWIGFVISSTLCFVSSIILCGFPKSLPGRKEVLRLKVSEAHGHSEQGGSDAFSGSIKEFPVMLKALLVNPTFILVSLGGTMEGLILSGFATFAPKFVQNQFGVTASSASFIVGAIAVPAGGGGTFFGGWIIKHKNLKLKGVVKLCIAFATISFFLCFGYLIQCTNSRFAGVNHPYINESSLSLNASCNKNCHCNKELYNPVCDASNTLHFSPCHAGCLTSQVITKGEAKFYSNCSCVESGKYLDGHEGFQAREGPCDMECKLLPVFLIFFFGVTVFTFMASMPALSTTLRSVPENQKSFALGIQWLIIRAFGTIPAAPIIGGIIDYSCVLWQEDCGEYGSCYYYDNARMGVYLMTAGLIVKFFAVLFLSATYLVYKPPILPKDEDHPEVDFTLTQEHINDPAMNHNNEMTEL